MASLKDIRRRISSVKNTQQITKAMKLVAASRLRKAQQAAMAARPFAEKLETMTKDVVAEILLKASALGGEKLEKMLTDLHPLLNSGTPTASGPNGEIVKKIAVVVISSDRGLCGGYNSGISKFAIKTITELRAVSGQQVDLFYYGKKGFEFCSRRGFKGEPATDFWHGKFAPSKTDKVAQLFIEKFLSGEYHSIQVIFTQFKSVITQTPTIKEILPLVLNGDPSSAKASGDAGSAIYEPSREVVLAKLLPILVKTQFYRLFADSLASEFGSRMAAMDNATRNAGDMISRLTLEANRVRQAGITRELMEIVGGAEAIKG